jgi:hypothetical protein
MGFFQATNGIDSKDNVQITGSLDVSGNIKAGGTISGAPTRFVTSSVYNGGAAIITFSPTSSYNVYSLNNTQASNVNLRLTKNADFPAGANLTLAVPFTSSNIDPLCTLTISYDVGANFINLVFNSGSDTNYVATFTAHDLNGGGFVNNGLTSTN